MAPGTPIEHVELSVREVRELTLSTVMSGPEHRGAHAIWLDPRLTK